jgi:hypothetical protein
VEGAVGDVVDVDQVADPVTAADSCKGRPRAAWAAKRRQDFGVIHRRLVGQQAGDRLDGVAHVLAAVR